MTLFENRKAAGEELSNYLNKKSDFDTIILIHPKDCKIVLQVAKEFNAEIEVKLSDFISSPDEPYAKIGSVTEDGTIWIDDKLQKEFAVTNQYIKRRAIGTSKYLKKKSKGINKTKNRVRRDSNILIITGAIENGFREASVVGSLLKEGAKNISIASPFKSRNTRVNLEMLSDKMYHLHELSFIRSEDSLYEKGKESTETLCQRDKIN